jgi:LysM repeat protein
MSARKGKWIMAQRDLGKKTRFGMAAALSLPRIVGIAAAAAGLLAFAPAAMATNPACGDAIRINPGDTLLRVANYCNTTIPALLAANPDIIQPNTVRVGQLVWMPGRNPAAPAPRPPVIAPPAASWNQNNFARCGASVQVRPGDTFSGIARRCGVTPAQLRAENPQVRDPNLIFSGMMLRVPSSLGPRPHQPPAPPVASQILRVTGTVTTEGVTCQAFRGDDGRLYTFAGTSSRPLRAGDRVEVTGTRAATSICQQGVTISATQIVLLDSVAPTAVDVTGTITREGVTCTALRGDDGRLYTITGQTAGFLPGDRVRITGDLAEMSFCQQGTTVNLRSIRSAW